ncbi:hypothetical protein GBA52_017885 [Prunus armeniaca]|nr:hypothetical protein GBA52_017885 [Prunus armeniaca]
MKNGVLIIRTLRNNIMASSLLATTAITLSSVISVFVSTSSSSSSDSTEVTFGPLDCEHSTSQFLFFSGSLGNSHVCLLLHIDKCSLFLGHNHQFTTYSQPIPQRGRENQ